jgi:hypothetical protein
VAEVGQPYKMTKMRRFWPPFWDAARRSPWATIGGIVLTVFSLVGGTVFWVGGLPSWAVFVTMLAAVLLVPVSAYHVASLAWADQTDALTKLREEVRAASEQKPRVELGKPQLQADGVLKRTQLSAPPQTSTGPAGPQYRVQAEQRPIRNYRIPVTNYGAYAPEVRVKVVNISPRVEGVSDDVPLHIAHDNPPLEDYTFKESFSLARGETKLLDVVAIDKQRTSTWYLWNINYQDADGVQEVKLGGTHWFVIKAFAGNASAEERYEVYGDSLETRLEMKGPLPRPSAGRSDF